MNGLWSIVKKQPGCDGVSRSAYGQHWCVAKTAAGETRLYVEVGGKWTDASLRHVPALTEYVGSEGKGRTIYT